MRVIAFWRIFMLHIGKRKSTEYIINTVGTFVSKEKNHVQITKACIVTIVENVFDNFS
jgi:hypothetical protein